jgi:hypothetical protein
MKKMAFILLISATAFADNMQFAKQLVRTEIENSGNQYEVTEILDIQELGILNKKYSFDVIYTKLFCTETSDTCALYKCRSLAQLDSDAIVDFESEQSSLNCEILPQ